MGVTATFDATWVTKGPRCTAERVVETGSDGRPTRWEGQVMAILEPAFGDAARTERVELELVAGGLLEIDLTVTEEIGRVPQVLVVDDDPETVVAVREVLGAQVVVVGLPDVYQALDHLERESVDLLLVELFLPGASGVDLLRRLTSRPGRVVALTHATSVAHVAPDVSVDSLLHKPPQPDALRDALEAAVAGRAQAGPTPLGTCLSV